MNNFEYINETLNNNNCKLISIIEKTKGLKINYIASCGHEHIVSFYSFKCRKTGIICPPCLKKRNSEQIKYKYENNIISKINNIESEYYYIINLIEMLKNTFNIVKAFDGCDADVIIKPIDEIFNNWVGVQIKTSNIENKIQSFKMNNNRYIDCIIILYSNYLNKTWIIPSNTIETTTSISIGHNSKKYNKYEIDNNNFTQNLEEKLKHYYNFTAKNDYENINCPKAFYHKREKEFRKYREQIIDFIKFDDSNMEGTVYDFKINNLKIQEKVSNSNIKDKNRCTFFLFKSNGCKQKKQYDIGDNDFYWLNNENKKYFVVIPEQILINKNIIGSKNNKQTLKINFEVVKNNVNHWLVPYFFNYETINNNESDKNRLLKLFEYF